jgi:hypothetical protein
VAQLSAETAARKALIYSLRRENTGQAGQYTLDGSAGNVSRTTTIQLERGPWESTTYIDARVEAVGCLASYTDTTKTISGDMPARIGYAKIEGTGAGTLYKFWMGFRTARYGIAANFQPYWSLSKAAAFDDDTTGGKTNPDNTARESCKTITTFATVTTLLRRATIRCSDVTSYPEDQRGTFRVLLRAKITGTAVVRVRLADGMYAAAAFTSRQRVSISSTSWQFYDMGSATVPVPGRFLTSAGQEANSAMGIDAELVSGSGDLEMDCLCMVPMSEGYVYADGGIVADNNDSLVASQLPEGGAIAIAYQSYTAFKTGNCTILKGLPVGAVYVMLCAQRETESYFDGSSSDAVDIGLRYFPRWGELRGAE